MPHTPPPPTRSDVEAGLIAELQPAGRTRARVVRFRWAEGEWILKDYAPCSWLGRWFIGPFSAWRERRAYALLEGIDGVPRALPAPDRRAIVIACVAGQPLSRVALRDPERFLSGLERLLERIHERGMAHFDLRTKTNLLVDERGLPWLIDFSSAVAFGRVPLLGRLLMKIGRFTDRSALVKYRARYAPALLDERDRSALRAHGRWRSVLVLPDLFRAWRGARRKRQKENAPPGEDS